MSRRSRMYRWVIAGALVLGGCGDRADAPMDVERDDPVPGELAFVLSSPVPDDGAVWIRVEGPDVSGAVSAPEGLVALTDRSGDALQVAVMGPALEGRVAALAVPDVRAAARYTARVVEVADGSNALRDDLAGYAVRIEPAR